MSIGRAVAFNYDNVKKYFNNLGVVPDKHQFTSDRNFTLDESVMTTVQNLKKI